MDRPLRIVLMGTGPFAVPSFRALVESQKHSVVLCITKPNPPVVGKGKAPINPVYEWALSQNFEIFQPATINEPSAIAKLQATQADLFLVCDYGQILSAEALSQAKLGGINLHGSLLPRHRGAAPVQWAILRGDATTGVSVIHMSPHLDAGPILAIRETPIGEHETAEQLEPRLAELGVACTLESIEAIAEMDSLDAVATLGKIQDPALVTKARRLSKQDGAIDWSFSCRVIDRAIRGLQPWPGAYGELNLDGTKQLRIVIKDSYPRPYLGTMNPAWLPGQVLFGSALETRLEHCQPSQRCGAKFAIACNDGVMVIDSLQPAGKRAMSSSEFLAGYQRFEEMQWIPPVANRLLQQLS